MSNTLYGDAIADVVLNRVLVTARIQMEVPANSPYTGMVHGQLIPWHSKQHGDIRGVSDPIPCHGPAGTLPRMQMWIRDENPNRDWRPTINNHDILNWQQEAIDALRALLLRPEKGVGEVWYRFDLRSGTC